MAIDEVPVGADGGVAGAAVVGPDLVGSLTVTELHQVLGEAVRAAGLVHLWVTGTVTGLRPGPKFTTFELVDYEDDGATVRAVLSVGVFARFAREMRKTLAVAGAELVDGLQVGVGAARSQPPLRPAAPAGPAGRSSHHGGGGRAGP